MNEHSDAVRAYFRELATILGGTVEDLPPVFRGDRARVLAVGIFHDIVRRYPHADADRLRDWLGRYTSAAVYLKRKIKAAHRNDLDGVNGAVIGRTAKALARNRLAILEPGGAQRPPEPARRSTVEVPIHAGR